PTAAATRLAEGRKQEKEHGDMITLPRLLYASLLTVLVAAPLAPAQRHQGGHLYVLEPGGGGFVYLVNPDTGKLTHLYPSLLGQTIAYHPKTGLWYGAEDAGTTADNPGVYWTLYASFNPENQTKRTLRLIASSTSSNGPFQN